MRRLTTEEFISKARKAHGTRYDYEVSNYQGGKKPVDITCRIHGVFTQRASAHVDQNQGCPKCNLGKASPMSHSQFIEKCLEVHGKAYDYSKTTYVNCRTKVVITCCKHGDFIQSPTKHTLKYQGCPSCNSSHGETVIRRLLSALGTKTIEEFSPEGCTDIGQLRYDFYVPEHNLLIEFDGEQHYNPRNKWHTEDLVRRDAIKDQWAKDNGFKLIRFRNIETIDCLETILG